MAFYLFNFSLLLKKNLVHFITFSFFSLDLPHKESYRKPEHGRSKIKFAETNETKLQKEKEEREEAQIDEENKRVRKNGRNLKKTEIDSDDIQNFTEEDFQNFKRGKRTNNTNFASTSTLKDSKKIPGTDAPVPKKSGRTVLRGKPIRYKSADLERIPSLQKDEKIDRKVAQAAMFNKLREAKEKKEE